MENNEIIENIKEYVKNKKYVPLLMIYYAQAHKLPSFTTFLKKIPEDFKKELIKYLMFIEKDPFLDKTQLLNCHFFDKLMINKKNKEFLKKRETVLKNMKG